MFFGNKAPFQVVLGLEEVLGTLVSSVLVLWLQRDKELAKVLSWYFLIGGSWLRPSRDDHIQKLS